jgi:hypothetical protein
MKNLLVCLVTCLLLVLSACGQSKAQSATLPPLPPPSPIPTDTPTPAPQPITEAFLGSTLTEIRAHFADMGNYAESGGGDSYLFRDTNLFHLGQPAYSITLSHGKVDSVEVPSYAHEKGAACAAFIPKDKKVVSTLITDSPTSPGAMTKDESGARTIYESKWLAKQFPASAFVDLTHLTSSDQPQPLAKPGTLTFTWGYVDDDLSYCSIDIGKRH